MPHNTLLIHSKALCSTCQEAERLAKLNGVPHRIFKLDSQEPMVAAEALSEAAYWEIVEDCGRSLPVAIDATTKEKFQGAAVVAEIRRRAAGVFPPAVEGGKHG